MSEKDIISAEIKSSVSKFREEFGDAATNYLIKSIAQDNFSRPSYSNIPPEVITERKANVGTAVVLYYFDPVVRQCNLVLVEAFIKNTDTALVQATGGFMNLLHEYTLQAAERETGEELRRNKDAALLPLITQNRFIQLDSGVKPNADRDALAYFGFVCALDAEEFEIAKDFVGEIHRDPRALTEMQDATIVHGDKAEIKSIHIFELSDLLRKVDFINHKDQISLFKRLAVYLHATEGYELPQDVDFSEVPQKVVVFSRPENAVGSPGL